MDLTHLTAPQILTAAAVVGAVGILVQAARRWIFVPLVSLIGFARDVAEQWRTTQQSLHELSAVVARYVVESERRLTRLEAMRDLDEITRSRSRDEADTLLGQQLAQALNHPGRRRTDHPEVPLPPPKRKPPRKAPG